MSPLLGTSYCVWLFRSVQLTSLERVFLLDLHCSEATAFKSNMRPIAPSGGGSTSTR
jgi:hypothetical protein